MNISLIHANTHDHMNTRRRRADEDNSKKLLIIAGMMFVIAYLVWSIG